MSSVAEDQELLNEVSIRCDIRRQVWEEFYEVFGYMLSETSYGELIEEEIERRYNIHCLKEHEVMNKIWGIVASDVSQDNSIASTLAVCSESPFPQSVGEEDVTTAPDIGPDFDYDAYWETKMKNVVADAQKEGVEEDKENVCENISYVLQNMLDF